MISVPALWVDKGGSSWALDFRESRIKERMPPKRLSFDLSTNRVIPAI